MLPKPKPRHTTNSNHRYHKYKNLIKGFMPTAANQLWVADITYIALSGGDVCYLHLITDAYSHKIVGWALAQSLKAAISIKALKMAIDQAVAMSGSEILNGLIHHSDRGVQYCCDAYVSMLKAHEISISMCEDYKPTDNAIAERSNGIIKVESVYRQKQLPCFEYAQNFIPRFIHFYNYRRPHMSIGYKIPAVVHLEQGEQKKMWKNKVYPKKQTENENNVVPLPSRTTSLGDGVCQRT
jgi:transposase InsO family protein